MEKYNGMLILRNDFHDTEAKVKVNNGIISGSSLKRAENKLCGRNDCSCGSIRGNQDMIIDVCYNYDGRYAKVYEK